MAGIPWRFPDSSSSMVSLIKDAITIVIPTIPARKVGIRRAIRSIDAQILSATIPNLRVVVVEDTTKSGAAVTRQNGLAQVETELVAFLDDDDEFLPTHIQTLFNAYQDSGADYIYPWFYVFGGTDPFPGNFGRPWDINDPAEIPVTTLARTETLLDVGGWNPQSYQDQNIVDNPERIAEDRHLRNRLMDSGASILHVPERTWIWWHGGSASAGTVGNTSGQL